MIFRMDNKPLEDFPTGNEAAGGQNERRPNPVTKWMESLAHLGLGEFAVRIGTNVLTLLVVVLVVWVMQAIYHEADLGWTPSVRAAGLPTSAAVIDPAQVPVALSLASSGIQRQAIPHTIIPSRPRQDVVQYTVQPGDSVFVIADKFGLKPSTILFSNKVLENDVDLLTPGEKLNILPVDGAYYQWQGTESLTGVAKYYNADAQAIVDAPANHLDPDTIGSLDNPKIAAGTWLVIPGGYYTFYWNAPVASRSGSSNARVTGDGYCGAINGGPVGFGTFIFPTVEHWLSGTDYRPDVRHFGVDFAGSLGNAVYATDAGVIVYAGWNDWGYGNLIIVDHGNGWQSLYGHLSQINVSCGQGVGQGDVIGLVGTTGHSTGPHLHFELSYNGAPVNPHTVFDIPGR
jgi:murein DD-endopeptidase MepM/ murein hydrolase activator NlpD